MLFRAEVICVHRCLAFSPSGMRIIDVAISQEQSQNPSFPHDGQNGSGGCNE